MTMTVTHQIQVTPQRDLSNFKGLLATDENMPYILLCMEQADDIAVDTETTGLRVADKIDWLQGFCVDVPGASAYIPFRHKEGNVDRKWLDPFDKILRRKPLIWHNRKFDMHSAATIGLDPLAWVGPQYDTLIIASLVNEELFSKELDYLAKRFLKKSKLQSDTIHKMGQIYGYQNLPAKVFEDYGPWDSVLTRELRDVLWPMLLREELASVYWDTERPFQDVLFKMEQRGVGVRSVFTSDKARKGRGRMGTIERELGFNPASPLDLKRVLLTELGLPVLKHTKSCEVCNPPRNSGRQPAPVDTHEGPPSFDKQAMEDYDVILEASENTTAKRIAEFRGWQKATTALYEPLLRKVGPDGRIRTNFNQHRTVTGRLSSSEPNLQQIPRGTDKAWNGDAKYCFYCDIPGYTLIGWDYSQLELRFSAAYGKEPVLLAEFEKPDSDVFKVLTPLIFNGQYSDELRHKTKNGFVYPNLYGAGIKKIALTLNMSVEEVKPLYDNYHASIPGIMRVSNQVTNLIKQRGFVRYWDGRRRHIRDKNDAFKGWNSLLQGGSAQLVKKAMLRCQEFEDEYCFMVLQVHDEITFCIKTDMIEHYRPLIEYAMTDFPDFGVHFAVESKEWGKK
jgi:DNA polymerase I